MKRRPLSHTGLGCGAQLLLGGLILGSLALTPLLLPVRCPGNCGPCDQLIGYTHLPGVTKEEAARMLDYWERQNCPISGKRRRIMVWECLPYWGICRD